MVFRDNYWTNGEWTRDDTIAAVCCPSVLVIVVFILRFTGMI